MFKKLDLYKKSIITFSKINNIEDIDYLVGIIFLSEMNKYCKINKVNYHGYYIACPLILLYEEIKNNILFYKTIDKNKIIDLYEGLCKNIEYLNDRIGDNNNIKININKNLYLMILNIKNEFENLFNENEKNYINIIDCLLKPYFYILLKISVYIGSGDISLQPNLYKLSEYYANIFYTFIILKNKNIENKQQLFENYTNNKIKLYESYLNLNNITDTIDEVIIYIDNIILKNFN
jgi:hypothetical protein